MQLPALPVLRLSLLLTPLWAGAAEVPMYNRDVRPIMAENCFSCHGADSASRKAELRLDKPADATRPDKDGVIAIVPGKPEESEAIRRMLTTDADDLMPPPEAHKDLKPDQIETIRQWIAAGAHYEAQWSFLPPVRPPVPAVQHADWPKNEIDRFLLARMESAGLSPAPEADRHTLVRRLALDLTGLPPEPAMVEEFVRDTSPDAWEKLVDRLMTTPQYGEHRARYWLDYARYADTHGIHFDNYREQWPYRDWVIRAINANMPFDQFTVEQLAGDLLPDATLEQQVASGFNRNNITTNEGGAIAEEYLVLYARDRTETTSLVWMGLTTGCAVCHDHKFDPITMKEFYSLSAFFNNTTQAAMDGNIKDTPPVMVVMQPEDAPRWETLKSEIPAAQARVEARRGEARAEFDAWVKAATPADLSAGSLTEGLALHLPLDEEPGQPLKVLTSDSKAADGPAATGAGTTDGPGLTKAFTVQPGQQVTFSEDEGFEYNKPFSFGAWVKVPAASLTGTLFAREDDTNAYRGWDLWLQNGRPATHLISSWSGDAIKVVADKPLEPGKWAHVFVTYDGSGKAAGVKIYVNGSARKLKTEADGLTGTIRNEVPFQLGQRHTSSRLDNISLQDVRLYQRQLPASDVGILTRNARLARVLAKPADQRTGKEMDEIYDWWLTSQDAEFDRRTDALNVLEQERDALKLRGATTMVMHEKDGPASAFVLTRGDYTKRAEPVTAATPAALPPMPEDLPRNRLGLAQWLLRPEHPLTARVTVNRFWQEIFGTGLVRSAGDFGVMGDLPSHQTLLDWLAVDFRESGWDMKRLVRLLVTSAAYRQSAVFTPEKLAADPDNRLLARGPRFRMDAEMVRDYALAVSGLLVEKTGGPSVRPYQPDGVWEAVAMPESNTRNYKHDSGDSLYRRSMYTFWKRAAPPASMDIFNAPAREVCTVRRERTNTPLQALTTLNDVQFIEAARNLAARVLREAPAGDDTTRLQTMARRVLARDLKPEELAVLSASLTDLSAYYYQHADDANALIAEGESKADPGLPAETLATWTMMANQLLNLDEALTK